MRNVLKVIDTLTRTRPLDVSSVSLADATQNGAIVSDSPSWFADSNPRRSSSIKWPRRRRQLIDTWRWPDRWMNWPQNGGRGAASAPWYSNETCPVLCTRCKRSVFLWWAMASGQKMLTGCHDMDTTWRTGTGATRCAGNAPSSKSESKRTERVDCASGPKLMRNTSPGHPATNASLTSAIRQKCLIRTKLLEYSLLSKDGTAISQINFSLDWYVDY